jgi:flagellar protein FliO/FliZ
MRRPVNPAWLLLTMVPVAFGEATQPFAAPSAAASGAASGAAGLGQVTVALGVVLLAIFAFAWVARRLRSVGGASGAAIEILGDVALGQKERAVLVKVGGTCLLIGVAPGNVRTLHVLPEGVGSIAPPAEPSERPTFRSLLMKSPAIKGTGR